MNRTSFSAVAVLLSVLAATAAAQSSVTLVGKDSVATVVLAAKPDESSKLAAEELTNHVHMITGKAMRVVEGCAGEAPRVFIGTLDAYPGEVPAAAKAYIASAKQGEAAWVGTVDGDLHVVGRREVAELYALYHFLESKLGVR